MKYPFCWSRVSTPQPPKNDAFLYQIIFRWKIWVHVWQQMTPSVFFENMVILTFQLPSHWTPKWKNIANLVLFNLNYSWKENENDLWTIYTWSGVLPKAHILMLYFLSIWIFLFIEDISTCFRLQYFNLQYYLLEDLLSTLFPSDGD